MKRKYLLNGDTMWIHGKKLRNVVERNYVTKIEYISLYTYNLFRG